MPGPGAAPPAPTPIRKGRMRRARCSASSWSIRIPRPLAAQCTDSDGSANEVKHEAGGPLPPASRDLGSNHAEQPSGRARTEPERAEGLFLLLGAEADLRHYA